MYIKLIQISLISINIAHMWSHWQFIYIELI